MALNNMKSTYFITGTDTDSGKTLISSALLYLASEKKLMDGRQAKTLGLKPIASGCEVTAEGLRNSDALALINESNIKLPYTRVNPISFKPAIAPHIAAKQENISLSINTIIDAIDLSNLPNYDFCLIEGAGGWRLPLGNKQFMSQVVKQLNIPVIIVVGMKLGCLNHAVLTQEAILNDGLTIAGWIANVTDKEMSYFDENLQSLKEMILSPLLGVVPYLSKASAYEAAKYLQLPK